MDRKKAAKNAIEGLVEGLEDKLKNLSLQKEEEIRLDEIKKMVKELLKLGATKEKVKSVLKEAVREWEKLHKRSFVWDLVKVCRLK